VLRILGPLELAGKYEWYELTLSPGGELASQGHDPGAQEHLTLLHGSVEVEVGSDKKKVKLGSTRATRPTSSTSSAIPARRKQGAAGGDTPISPVDTRSRAHRSG
jgi:hypothetical protein